MIALIALGVGYAGLSLVLVGSFVIARMGRQRRDRDL
jgi:hypothetical protein